MSDPVSLRPISADDREFLLKIYGSTREEELKLVPWSDHEKLSFVEQQFEAQHSYYQQHFADAAFDLILKNDEPIGRCYVDRREEEIRVIDIALLPSWRGQGIGTQLMQQLLQEAAMSEKCVRLHVEHNNPAARLYERLGFKDAGRTEVSVLMEWTNGNEAQ